MTETLLSLTNILLFGRRVTDLGIVDPPGAVTEVDYATRRHYPQLSGHRRVDGQRVTQGDRVLVTRQNLPIENGTYTVGAANAAWVRDPTPAVGAIFDVTSGSRLAETRWTCISVVNNAPLFSRGRGGNARLGSNSFLENQLEGGSFARIYGFSYEGTYYDLAKPVIFLVHGEGELVTETSAALPNRARAPRSPTITGLAAADFDFSDDLRVWSYDRADYTIRLDVEAGMFEDVLLDPFFTDGGGAGLSGAKVAGAKVSGAKLSGSRVSGAKISGAKMWGGRGDATD